MGFAEPRDCLPGTAETVAQWRCTGTRPGVTWRYNSPLRTAMAEETLIQKIRSLPPERVAEVEDFVDFLTARDQDRHFTQAAARLSEDAFRAVWDNSDDAEYDRL
jgi:hypothetical protein